MPLAAVLVARLILLSVISKGWWRLEVYVGQFNVFSHYTEMIETQRMEFSSPGTYWRKRLRPNRAEQGDVCNIILVSVCISWKLVVRGLCRCTSSLWNASPFLVGYVLRANDQHGRAFPAHSLERKNTCVWMGLASERLKRTLWWVTVTKLVCPQLPWSLAWAAPIKSSGEIIGKTDCNNRDSLQIADKHFTSNVEQARADADKHHLLCVLISSLRRRRL